MPGEARRLEVDQVGHRLQDSVQLRAGDSLGDGTYISRIGAIEVRVITATITVVTGVGADMSRRSEAYRLITTILDPGCPASEIVILYHERWEIETACFELKSTILGGRVLRARTPTGVEQEIYALLVTYQALRLAISDATLTRPEVNPDRGSFTIALNAARDQLTAAEDVITDTDTAAVDLVGVIGSQVLIHVLPQRRARSNPRVVKRAISVYATNTARRRIRRPSQTTTTTIQSRSPAANLDSATHGLTERLCR